MEQWKRKVSDAIKEFSEAKAKENELLSVLKNAETNVDYVTLIEIKKWLSQLRQSAHEKNEAVLHLLWNPPDSSRSISNSIAQNTNLN